MNDFKTKIMENIIREAKEIVECVKYGSETVCSKHRTHKIEDFISKTIDQTVEERDKIWIKALDASKQRAADYISNLTSAGLLIKDNK